jgi:predicted Zn-dependent protease
MTPARHGGGRLLAITLMAALLAGGCAGNAELPPPAWDRIENATVAERQFTPEAEHFLGRAIAAQLIYRYGLDQNPAARKYLAVLGTYLAYANNMSVPYRGYHFGILATREPLAFSTPGGYVFISRGMLETVRSEEELAGVIAHELGHLQGKDGIRSVGQSKATSMLTMLGTLTLSLAGGGGLAGALLQSFEGAVDHAVTDLVSKGYSRRQELAADAAAIRIMTNAGYPARSYLHLTSRMFADQNGKSASLLSTHPASTERLDALGKLVGQETAAAEENPARRKRFIAAAGKVGATQP